MQNINEIRDFSNKWGVVSEDFRYLNLLPLLDKIALHTKGFFLFKIDGERNRKRYSFVANFPQPFDIVIRKDTDDFEEGILYIISELMAHAVYPLNSSNENLNK